MKKDCTSCKHRKKTGQDMPCKACLEHSKRKRRKEPFTKWEIKTE